MTSARTLRAPATFCSALLRQSLKQLVAVDKLATLAPTHRLRRATARLALGLALVPLLASAAVPTPHVSPATGTVPNQNKNLSTQPTEVTSTKPTRAGLSGTLEPRLLTPGGPEQNENSLFSVPAIPPSSATTGRVVSLSSPSSNREPAKQLTAVAPSDTPPSPLKPLPRKAEPPPAAAVSVPPPSVEPPAVVHLPLAELQPARPARSDDVLSVPAASRYSFFYENAGWLVLMLVTGMGVVYCLWAWFNSYLRPRLTRSTARAELSQPPANATAPPPSAPEDTEEPSTSTPLKEELLASQGEP